MAPSPSHSHTTESAASRQRKRKRYSLVTHGKKRHKSATDPNRRMLVVIGLLAVALLAAIVTIALHLIPLSNGY